MAGLWAWISTILPTCWLGPRTHWGGIWGHGGVASDGTNMFVVTGNTFTNPGDPWSGGEAIVRFKPDRSLTDFWAPSNWQTLDDADADLGGCSATLIDVPGANPSQLVLALGKDRNAYLLDRNNLGGVSRPVAHDECFQFNAQRYVVCCIPDW